MVEKRRKEKADGEQQGRRSPESAKRLLMIAPPKKQGPFIKTAQGV